MTIRAADRPFVILTRHFFVRLFDFELLSESGAGSLARTVTGIAGILFAFGALLARVSMKRYAFLRETGDAAFFQATVLTDHTFLLAAPMWIVAVVAVLTGPSLFPDETDFRVLTALPVERRVVFGAKLAALGLFAGIFLVIAQVALLPVFLMTAMGQLASPSVFVQLPAFLVAGVLGGLFAALSVTAVHAILLLAVPRERLMPLSAALGSAMLFALVMALPLVGRIPSFHTAFESGATWLYVFPPAWFVGLERWLVGDARFAALAASAVGALIAAASVAGAAYLVLYRDFARVMMRPAGDQGERLPASPVADVGRVHARPAFTAVRSFTFMTMRRSVVHQGVFIAVSAIGAAIVTNSLLDLDFSPRTVSARFQLRDAVLWAPFALSFVAILAARAALFIPIELRANWMFRITERPRDRADQLDASVATVLRLGVLLPAGLLLPVQWLALGPVAMLTTLVSVLWGWLLVEALMVNWRRIPFTCTYIVGKGFMPQLVLLGFLAFVGFTTIGRGLAYGTSVRSPSFGLTASALLVAIGLGLRRHRRHSSIVESLQFEDALPTEANALKLSGD